MFSTKFLKLSIKPVLMCGRLELVNGVDDDVTELTSSLVNIVLLLVVVYGDGFVII